MTSYGYIVIKEEISINGHLFKLKEIYGIQNISGLNSHYSDDMPRDEDGFIRVSTPHSEASYGVSIDGLLYFIPGTHCSIL